MSRRLRGSTTILFLLLQTPEPAAQPFTDRERTVYPRHPLPILFHHLLVSPPSLPPSPSPLPPSLPLSTSPSFPPLPSLVFRVPILLPTTRSLFLSGATIGLGRLRRIHYAFVQFAEFWDRRGTGGWAVVGGGGRESSTRRRNGDWEGRREKNEEEVEEEAALASRGSEQGRVDGRIGVTAAR